MPPRLTRRFCRAAIVGAMSGLMIIGALGTVRAEEDDNELPDQKFFRNFMTGLGLRKNGQVGEEIEFRERSPLVVPPTRDLPPPETTSATQANPAWPVDQDARRSREAKKADTRSAASTWEDLSRQVRPDELNRGATANPDKSGQQRTGKDDESYSNPLKPSELGYTGGLFSFGSLFGGKDKEETAKFDREPPRAALTDPPTGYRTPSANQPYGINKTAEPTKPLDKYDIPNQGAGSTAGGTRH